MSNLCVSVLGRANPHAPRIHLPGTPGGWNALRISGSGETWVTEYTINHEGPRSRRGPHRPGRRSLPASWSFGAVATDSHRAALREMTLEDEAAAQGRHATRSFADPFEVPQ